MESIDFVLSGIPFIIAWGINPITLFNFQNESLTIYANDSSTINIAHYFLFCNISFMENTLCKPTRAGELQYCNKTACL